MSSSSAVPSFNSISDYYNHQGPTVRSMSTSFPPLTSSDLRVDSRSVEEREIARQRRRNSQENRRQSKLRLRKTRLPSILDVGLGGTQVMGGSVDFSPAAPSNMTAYVSGPNERTYSGQSYASSRSGYSDVVSG
ncbi:hypothetical protein MMC11_005564 [Xylographa trunciseda]|nr:hypothetical protein [Xylographa trunciseda]